MLNLNSLETFYWVAKLNSFHKAASKVHATQPAVSHRIAALEKDLGVTLFERTTRSVQLTPRGRALLEYAERFLRLHAEMLTTVTGSDSLVGTVRLGVAETIVHTWLTDFLESAHHRYPDLVIDISVDITPAMRHAVADGVLDMAFLLASPQQSDALIEKELCRYNLNFVASPDLRIGPGPLTAEALSRHPVITLPKGTYPYTLLRDWLAVPDNHPPRIFATWSMSTIIKMAVDCIGIAVIPTAAVEQEIEQGILEIKEAEIELQDFVFAVTYADGADLRIHDALTRLAKQVAR
ncbi:LysR family transcriptional regulator [Saccharopolyspora spinosa]|uniref:LysR family transcriptional regulator n=1 Tax=Saccharopolyspora spinosa TaxID=60894 RepID=A0A2N3XZR7_SACSN|nr:LysR family transcriptional regulator [Saccharopolyspora spinosa]PKW16120.1 LysR family transcriptional regulator [Saccharopolyspora spinosa]